MINRRRVIQSLAAAATTPAMSSACRARDIQFGALTPDTSRLVDLPEGFELTVVSRAGDAMDDGFKVPPAHDGMAAFAGESGRVILVCNHEMLSAFPEYNAFGPAFGDLPAAIKNNVYDWGGGETPGAGGTTTTIYNPATRKTERQHLSLGGTELNCAGGPTPWGSWLSCEETFTDPGAAYLSGRRVVREEKHGYVFEVPAQATELVEAQPLKELGRFEHEAAAVHEASGIVYLTEDRYHSLFYRFVPNIVSELNEGGRLQALGIAEQKSMPTHNWGRTPDIKLNEALRTVWIDLENVDPVENDLRLRGAAAGAATFARGEGLCNAGGEFAFTCTIGGPALLGQVFRYVPSAFEGTARESESPGHLELIAEAGEDSLLRHCDNLTMAPWGDLIVCEDTVTHCGLVGIRPDGSQYELADHPYSNSELAGVCFSPDGKTLFVNIQYPGLTVAITGPWPT